MRKRVYVMVMGVALALVLTAGGLIASNMGFKLNYPLAAAGAGSVSGTNMIALPYNQQSGINNAKNLMDDVGFASVANVQRFVESSDGLEVYTGRKGSPGSNFTLTPGEGYFIKMNSTVNYIIVGSHDPSLGIPLDAAGAGSNSGTNLFAYPYHSTSANAKNLMDDIGFASVANVQRFLEASDGLEVYTGRKGSPGSNFALVPGEAYFLKMNSTVNYVPSHY